MSPASTRHQDIADFLTAALRLFVEHHDAGRVLSAPFQMKLENGREPDVLFVASDHLSRPMKTHMESRKRSSVYEGNDVLFEKPPHALS